MTTGFVATSLALVGLMSCAGYVSAAEAVSEGKAVRNGWDGKWFAYERADEPVVAAATPTEAQVDWVHRPPQAAGKAALQAVRGDMRPRPVGPMDVIHLRYEDTAGDIVPA